MPLVPELAEVLARSVRATSTPRTTTWSSSAPRRLPRRIRAAPPLPAAPGGCRPARVALPRPAPHFRLARDQSCVEVQVQAWMGHAKMTHDHALSTPQKPRRRRGAAGRCVPGGDRRRRARQPRSAGITPRGGTHEVLANPRAERAALEDDAPTDAQVRDALLATQRVDGADRHLEKLAHALGREEVERIGPWGGGGSGLSHVKRAGRRRNSCSAPASSASCPCTEVGGAPADDSHRWCHRELTFPSPTQLRCAASRQGKLAPPTPAASVPAPRSAVGQCAAGRERARVTEGESRLAAMPALATLNGRGRTTRRRR